MELVCGRCAQPCDQWRAGGGEARGPQRSSRNATDRRIQHGLCESGMRRTIARRATLQALRRVQTHITVLIAQGALEQRHHIVGHAHQHKACIVHLPQIKQRQALDQPPRSALLHRVSGLRNEAIRVQAQQLASKGRTVPCRKFIGLDACSVREPRIVGAACKHQQTFQTSQTALLSQRIRQPQDCLSIDLILEAQEQARQHTGLAQAA